MREPEEIKEGEWVNTVSREIPVLFNCLIVKSYKKVYPKVDLAFMAEHFANNTTLCGQGISIDSFRYKPSYEKLNAIISKKIKQDEGLFKEAHKKAVNKTHEIDQVQSQLQEFANKKELKLDDFQEWFFKVRELFISFFALQVLPFIIEQVLSEADNKQLLEDTKDILVEWREKTHQHNTIIEESLHSFLDKFESTFEKDIKFWKDQEIKKFFQQGDVPNEKVIQKRREGYIMTWNISQEPPYKVVVNDQAGKLCAKLKKITQEKVADKTLTGTPVSRGLVEGEVVVIEQKDDYKTLSPGKIVVSEVVELEDLKILKNRDPKAIITKEGGVTSHIAISGRELDIPIVMGVENATSLLDTEDSVEVDANAGVVRITG